MRIIGTTNFTYALGGDYVFGTLFLDEPSEIRIYLKEFSFHSKSESWKSEVLTACVRAMREQEIIEWGHKYDIAIEVPVMGDSVGAREFVARPSVLSQPIQSDAIAPGSKSAGDISFLSNASVEDIFNAAIREISNAKAQQPRTTPAAWAVESYEKYATDQDDYGNGDYFLVLTSDFDPDEYLNALDSEEIINLLGQDRADQWWEGSELLATELSRIESLWIEQAKELGSESPYCSVFSIVQHGEVSGRWWALWELSGHSFDGFKASFDGIFEDKEGAIDQIKSRGLILD